MPLLLLPKIRSPIYRPGRSQIPRPNPSSISYGSRVRWKLNQPVLLKPPTSTQQPADQATRPRSAPQTVFLSRDDICFTTLAVQTRSRAVSGGNRAIAESLLHPPTPQSRLPIRHSRLFGALCGITWRYGIATVVLGSGSGLLVDFGGYVYAVKLTKLSQLLRSPSDGYDVAANALCFRIYCSFGDRSLWGLRASEPSRAPQGSTGAYPPCPSAVIPSSSCAPASLFKSFIVTLTLRSGFRANRRGPLGRTARIQLYCSGGADVNRVEMFSARTFPSADCRRRFDGLFSATERTVEEKHPRRSTRMLRPRLIE
jgi:hypothetical protein